MMVAMTKIEAGSGAGWYDDTPGLPAMRLWRRHCVHDWHSWKQMDTR